MRSNLSIFSRSLLFALAMLLFGNPILAGAQSTSLSLDPSIAAEIAENTATDAAVDAAKGAGLGAATGGVGSSLLGSLGNLVGAKLGIAVGGVPVNDIQTNLSRQESKFKFTLDGLAWVATNRIIAQMTKSVVSWINSGFEGSPAFVTNPKQFFLDVADQVSGAYIQRLGLSNALCSPFRAQILLSITEYARNPIPRYQCTLSAAAQNFNNFLTDFNNGGWSTWIELSRRENNPYAQLVDAAAELDREKAVEANIKQQELQWGRGFISMRNPYNVNEITTPGSIIESQLNDALDSSSRRLEVADSINEVVTALADQLISKVLTGAQGLLGSTKRQPGASASYFDQVAANQDRDALYSRDSILSFMRTDILREQQYLAYKQSSLAALVNAKTGLEALQKCYLGDRAVALPATGISAGLPVQLQGSGISNLSALLANNVGAGAVSGSPDANALALAAAASTTIETQILPLIPPIQIDAAASVQFITELNALSSGGDSAQTAEKVASLATNYSVRRDTFHNDTDIGAAEAELAEVQSRMTPLILEARDKLVACKAGILQ
ncbi:MAG: hypothetical protein V4674_01800 [Patescibacteria group bacterium]